MPRTSAVAAIEARQRREQYMQEFNAARAVETRQRIHVDWEKRVEPRAAQRELLRHLDEVQAAQRDTLVARRTRLATLLSNESAEYERMLSGLTETDEQRRERLIRKAQELRARREEEKRLDTEARHGRLFREKIDCLRQAESRLKVMQVADARYEQLADRAARKSHAQEEERFYAQQVIEAQRRATERAQRDLEQQYASRQRQKEDLAAQVAGNAARKVLAEEAQAAENAEFYRLLHEEQTIEAQKQLARRAARVAMAAEMKAMNEELQRARAQEYEQLRAEDKATLDRILSEIAAEEATERANKLAAKAAMAAEMAEANKQAAQRRADDHALDQLWHEASEAEWAKREARWNAEQAARDALLRNILIIRRQQVLDKRARERAAAEDEKKEQAAFLAALAAEGDVDATARAKRMAMLKELQKYLDAQISEKRAAQEAEREERRAAHSAQQALESSYQDRIAHELAALEAAKPERYKDIPLLPRVRGRNILE